MNKTMRVVLCASVMAAAGTVAMPSYAELSRADRLGTALLVEPPITASASAGSSAPGAARTMPAVLRDGRTPDRVMMIAQKGHFPPDNEEAALTGGFPWINVNYGDEVLFIVRQPGGGERTVEWKFNGLDNVIGYADIDPGAEFARNIKIYVNHSSFLGGSR